MFQYIKFLYCGLITEIDFNYAVLSRDNVLVLMANWKLQKEMLRICHTIFVSILTMTKSSSEVSQKCQFDLPSLREKCPNTEFFYVPYFPVFELKSKSPYSVRLRENADQKKLRIWRLFTQWMVWSL